MAWQDMFAGSPPRINAEYEQELHLATQARLGADWALGALIARYQPTVTRYLTRLTGNAPHAKLLSEKIFLRMERRLHGPHGGQHLRLWLLRACTELGLDELRQPHHGVPRIQLSASESLRHTLLPEVPSSQQETSATVTDTGKVFGATDRIRAGLGALADRTGTTGRQLRQLIWSPWSNSDAGIFSDSDRHPQAPQTNSETATTKHEHWDTEEDSLSEDDLLEPREVLRYRMIRAVLAELPYGDAQCLALHLIANLNQAEVARALGITSSATRRRIVSGLQLFAQRYEAATASLGISLEALEGTEPSEAESETYALSDSADDASANSIPSQRPPIVVSAELTTPLRMDSAVSEDTTIVWDLPPFVDAVDTPSQIATLPEAEADEEPRTAAEHEVTRRLMWSHPAAYRQTPITSGDAVTTRLTRSSQSNTSAHSAANPAGNMDEVWMYSENIETIAEPPPPDLVVDAVDPVETAIEPKPEEARTVPILTTYAAAPPATTDDAKDNPVLRGSSSSVGQARLISVLTPASLEDSPMVKSEPGDQYHPGAP